MNSSETYILKMNKAERDRLVRILDAYADFYDGEIHPNLKEVSKEVREIRDKICEEKEIKFGPRTIGGKVDKLLFGQGGR